MWHGTVPPYNLSLALHVAWCWFSVQMYFSFSYSAFYITFSLLTSLQVCTFSNFGQRHGDELGTELSCLIAQPSCTLTCPTIARPWINGVGQFSGLRINENDRLRETRLSLRILGLVEAPSLVCWLLSMDVYLWLMVHLTHHDCPCLIFLG